MRRQTVEGDYTPDAARCDSDNTMGRQRRSVCLQTQAKAEWRKPWTVRLTLDRCFSVGEQRAFGAGGNLDCWQLHLPSHV